MTINMLLFFYIFLISINSLLIKKDVLFLFYYILFIFPIIIIPYLFAFGLFRNKIIIFLNKIYRKDFLLI